MLIEIVQHECNKVVKEATLEQALEYANNFTVNLVDAEGNRTPFVPADHAPAVAADAADEAPADEVQPEAQAEAPAEVAAAPAAKKAAKKAA